LLAQRFLKLKFTCIWVLQAMVVLVVDLTWFGWELLQAYQSGPPQ
jgi:hypothetical protein